MVTALARRMKLEVSATGADGTWLPFTGLNDLSPNINPNMVDANTYDTDGWSSSEVTMQNWDITAKALHQVTSGSFTPGQELVRAARGKFGDLARVFVRWYDRNGLPEAYMGKAIPEWSSSKTGVADLDEIAVKFNGDGVLAEITNPYSVAAVPVVTSIQKTGKGAGQAVSIFGANFTGVVATTGVKFGGTNATSFDLISDGQIIAVLPAGAAGTVTVLVTTAAGPSVQTNNYTRIV